MNKIIILVIALFFLNNCSFNENSRIWKEKEKKLESQKKLEKVFAETNPVLSEFNPELKIDLIKIKLNNKVVENKNNYGFQNYDGSLNKIANYKFSKLENIDQLNFKPIFLKDGLIFFDKKGSIIRFNNMQKVLWTNNYYSKVEKKLKPKLYFASDNENLFVFDDIAKFYSVNINSGKLNWIKNNIYPFNSEIK